MSTWARHANAVAQRYRGCGDPELVFNALKEAVELTRADGTIYMATDDQLMENARLIASGSAALRFQ